MVGRTFSQFQQPSRQTISRPFMNWTWNTQKNQPKRYILVCIIIHVYIEIYQQVVPYVSLYTEVASRLSHMCHYIQRFTSRLSHMCHYIQRLLAGCPIYIGHIAFTLHAPHTKFKLHVYVKCACEVMLMSHFRVNATHCKGQPSCTPLYVHLYVMVTVMDLIQTGEAFNHVATVLGTPVYSMYVYEYVHYVQDRSQTGEAFNHEDTILGTQYTVCMCMGMYIMFRIVVRLGKPLTMRLLFQAPQYTVCVYVHTQRLLFQVSSIQYVCV